MLSSFSAVELLCYSVLSEATTDIDTDIDYTSKHFTQLTCSIEVRQTTKQHYLLAIIQSRLLSLFGHIARMPHEADAKKILTASAPPPQTTEGHHWDVLIYCGPEILEPFPE